MNTALVGAGTTAVRPHRRSLSLDWMSRWIDAAREARGRMGSARDREEVARLYRLRQDARSLREAQFRTGAFARLL